MSTYEELIGLLDDAGVAYKLIDHAPDGTTETVSALRGHPVAQGAKCIILIVKPDKRTTKYVLAVVPGDRRVDLDAIKQLYGARYVGFADAATAERLARTVPGTVLPFSLDPELDLIADPAVVVEPEIYFNAARLDRSIMMSGPDYAAIANPRIEPIAPR
ncbi:YbaK/EbsC family protein [Kribbella sp. NPDC004536]|uniref:YbaK/EbsC family protein n=1 Tax=Kribbella sp. NPDC004536 TaxID=3364106 RepID=UPI00368B752C